MNTVNKIKKIDVKHEKRISEHFIKGNNMKIFLCIFPVIKISIYSYKNSFMEFIYVFEYIRKKNNLEYCNKNSIVCIWFCMSMDKKHFCIKIYWCINFA